MRATIVPALTAAALVAVPATAHAAPPERDLPPSPDPFEVVDTTCGVDVLVEGDGSVGSIAYDDDTVRQIFPGARLTLTNLESGDSVTVAASGPALDTTTDADDGGYTLTRVGTGRWVIPTGGSLLSISGRWTGTLVVDGEGDVVSLDYDFGTARVVDLCDVLT